MRIVLVRHAHAIDGDHLGDGQRWLTAHGRAVARALGGELGRRGFAFDVLVTSPLVRAVQTAELLVTGLGWAGTPEVLPELAPGGSVRAAAAELAQRGGDVCAVGHEPGISALAGTVLGRAVSGFRKGQALVIEDGALVASVDGEGAVVAPA